MDTYSHLVLIESLHGVVLWKMLTQLRAFLLLLFYVLGNPCLPSISLAFVLQSQLLSSGLDIPYLSSAFPPFEQDIQLP